MGYTYKKGEGKNVWHFYYLAPPVPGERRKGGQKRETLRDLSLAEAKKVMDKKLGLIATGRHGGACPDLLHDHLSVMAADRQHATKTRERDETLVRQIIAHVDGGATLLLRTLDESMVQRLQDRLLTCGADDGGPLSSTTVMKHMALLNKATARATRFGKLPRNVCAAVDRLKAASFRANILETPELVAFLDTMRGTPVYSAVLLAACAGLRRGELLALTWDDIDFVTGKLKVKLAVAESRNGRVELKLPKSNKERDGALTSAGLAALRVQRDAQAVIAAKMGPKWNPRGYVVPCVSTGGIWGPRNFSRVCDLALAASGYRIGLHGLRHSYVSALIAAGVDVLTVSSLAGHSSPAFTLRVYGHLFKNAQVDGAAKLDAAMRQSGFGAVSVPA